MNDALAVLRMFRLPNLAIVAACQILPYYMVLRPAILRGGVLPALGDEVFLGICLNTVLTTLAGYLVNDFFDSKIDALNKPERVVIGKFLPRGVALFIYISLVFSTLGLAAWIEWAFFPGNGSMLFTVFAGVTLLLFLYSKMLKCTPVLGNVAVAVLCAIVPLVVWLPEKRPLQILEFQDVALAQHIRIVFWNIMIFAGLTTLFREMVKDLEDLPGDAACECRTLPVIRGPRTAKRLAGIVGFALTAILALLIFFWKQTGEPTWKIFAGIFCLILPVLFAVFKTIGGAQKSDFSSASLAIKLVMLAGIILLCS